MVNTIETYTFNAVAERLRSDAPMKAVGEVVLTAAGFLHPPHERLYRTTRELLRDTDMIALQPSLHEMVDATSDLIADAAYIQTSTLDTAQQTRLVNTLVQFSDRASASAAMKTPYGEIERIYESVIEKAMIDGPVNYVDQLAIALEQTPHIPSALWNLLLTSRQYARWRDTDVIDGFPVMETQQKIEHMLAWERSVAAVKGRDTHGFQDAAGDGYYVWTHALARVIYTALPQSETNVSRGYAKAFEYGSYAMSASAALGKVSVFGTMSNHIPASRYGNAIGNIAADRVKAINASVL